MTSSGVTSAHKSALVDPEYIQFLLNPDLEFNCYFVVGNPKLAPVEKIGVVRKMLAAHSEVFRKQVCDTKWKTEEPEHITDIFPATFRNLLRFVYGFDFTDTMCFEDADDLLYVADRYIIPRLKNKLASRLMYLLDYSNIVSLLTNPACSSTLELQAEITMVLQYQTDKILAHPEFLNCCPETFVRILEQEALNISELELWRAAVTWAKNRAKSEDPKHLRQQLKKPLQHLRVCALPVEEFRNEVSKSGIFTKEEVQVISFANGAEVKPTALTGLCDELELRTQTIPCSKQDGIWYDESEEDIADTRGMRWVGIHIKEMSFTLQTLESTIKIMTLVCFVYDKGLFNFTVTIQQVGSTESVVAHSYHNTEGYTNLPIAISTSEREVVLSAKTTFKITISCDRTFYAYTQYSPVVRHEAFVLNFCNEDERSYYKPRSPVALINYTTLILR